MARLAKQKYNLDDYQNSPIVSLDRMGNKIFKAYPEIQAHHPQVVKKYYQIFLGDYQKDDRYSHTEKIDDLTYQRLTWLKDQKCGYYHDIINRAVLMAYVMYRENEAHGIK